MFLISCDTLKRRLAREWVKMQSQRGPFTYHLAERRVINNKPHIILKKYEEPPKMMYPFMGG